MNKMKCILKRLFSKKSKLSTEDKWDKYCEIRKRYVWVFDNVFLDLYIPKGYNNPKTNFIKDWLDTPIKQTLFPYTEYNLVTDQAKLLDDYMRFSYDLFCYLRDNKYDIRSLTTYEKYVKQFDVKVPGFIKPVENE